MILEVTIIGDENDGDNLTNIFDIKHDQIQYIPEVIQVLPAAFYRHINQG